jgi:predicted dehydrogenase
MSLRLAFVGFRHAHILDLYRRALVAPGIEVVGACEEDAGTREWAQSDAGVEITYQDYDRMLATVGCDAVAVGDVYGKRGQRIIKALESGRHVISDKPICTSLAEWGRIERLSKTRLLRIGCMLDMRDMPQFIGARELVRQGRIGEVLAVSFGGQHPLLLGRRPAWYFEPGQHGGTINDIAVHALDAIPWITGQQVTEIVAARTWNALAVEFPHFRDAGQLMLTLDEHCGVLGDVSYFAPDSQGYASPLYWRTTFWGRDGVLETAATADAITVAANGASGVEHVSLPTARPGGYLVAFLQDIGGESRADELTTERVLRATRLALLAQWAADVGSGPIKI